LLYVPIFQEFGGPAWVAVRSASDRLSGIVQIQRAVAATDKQRLPALRKTGPEHSSDSLWQQQFTAVWIGVFSVMALLSAALGLYAVVTQSVAQRTREVGIRRALGVGRSSVAALVVKRGMLLSLAGLSIGFPDAIGFNGLGATLSRWRRAAQLAERRRDLRPDRFSDDGCLLGSRAPCGSRRSHRGALGRVTRRPLIVLLCNFLSVSGIC
jgi:hypothetical protein